MKMKLSDIEADNVEQAMKFYRQSVADGTWDRDTAHILLHMQQNPDDLLEAISKEPKPSSSSGPSDQGDGTEEDQEQ